MVSHRAGPARRPGIRPSEAPGFEVYVPSYVIKKDGRDVYELRGKAANGGGPREVEVTETGEVIEVE